MLHGSETRPVRRENELALLTAEMRMVRQKSGVEFSDKVACEKLRDRLRLEDVVTVLQSCVMVLDLEVDQREHGRK